ncbi:MAG: hypothetical protein ACI88A_003292 [Paraglaciecola sp.]
MISFPEPEACISSAKQQLHEGHHDWRVIRELDKDLSTLEVINDNGTYRLENIDLIVKREAKKWYSYQGDDFHSPKGKTLWRWGFKRGDWAVETVTRTLLQCDEFYFYLDAELDAYEGDKRIYSKNGNLRIKRNLV